MSNVPLNPAGEVAPYQDSVNEEDEIFTDDDDRRPLLPDHSSSVPYQASPEASDASNVSYKTQYIAAFCATLAAFAMGTVLGYSSPAAPLLLNSTDPNLALTENQISWFSSTVNLGALVGGPVGGYCINYFGRRGTMIFSILPFVIGWVLLVAAQNFAMLLLGRLVTGFCCGIVSLTVPTYIGEYSSPKIRGFLGSCFQLMVTIGILYTYSMGAAFDNFRWIGAVCLIIPVLHSLTMLGNKESPVFLISKDRIEDATTSLQYFRGPNCDITGELVVMKDSLEVARQSKVSLKDLKAPYIIRPLLISLGLMVFQQFSGINAVLFNLDTIFHDAGSTMSDTLSSIIVGVMQVVGTIGGTILMDRAGRKLLLLVSSILMALPLVALGVYFYLAETQSVENLGWLPLLSLVIYIVAFSVGFGPIPWLMMGEIFSSDIREVAASMATFTNWSVAFIVTEIYSPLKNAIDDYGVYWLFAACNVLSFLFVLFFVYETKGKSIEEITAHFGGPVAKAPSAQMNGKEDHIQSFRL